MLTKSFVTVAVTTSYRNKNWESNIFGTRAVVRYKANKGGRTCK